MRSFYNNRKLRCLRRGNARGNYPKKPVYKSSVGRLRNVKITLE